MFTLWGIVLESTLVHTPAYGQARPDLSRLPTVVDDEPPKAEKGQVPDNLSQRNQVVAPYVGQMLTDPDIDFVPPTPTQGVNAKQVWEELLVPPPPSEAEMKARRMRGAGIALLALGSLFVVIAVPTLASNPENRPAEAAGYTFLSLSLASYAAGGPLYAVGELRWRKARKSQAGLLP